MSVAMSVGGATTCTRTCISTPNRRRIRPRQRRGSRRGRYHRTRRDRRVPRRSRSRCLSGCLYICHIRGDDDFYGWWVPHFAWRWSRWYATSSPFFTSLLFLPLSFSLFPFPISPLFPSDTPSPSRSSSHSPSSYPRGSTVFPPASPSPTRTSDTPPRTPTPRRSRRNHP